MPFGMVSGVGLGMGVLDFDGERRRGRGSFEGEFGASYGNQWGLCDALFSNYFEDLLYARRYASEVFAKALCQSVRLSVCHPEAAVILCQNG